MDQIVKCLLLKNDLIVISEIVEIAGELGEPDCKLTNPFRMVKQKETDSYMPPSYCHPTLKRCLLHIAVNIPPGFRDSYPTMSHFSQNYLGFPLLIRLDC